MQLDIRKELTPVIFNENSIKIFNTEAAANIQMFPPHWHDRMEFLVIEEGSLFVNFSNHSYEYMPGDVAIFCPKQLHHGTTGASGVKYICLMLDLNSFVNDSSTTIKYIEPINNSKITFSNYCSNKEFIEAIKDVVTLTKSKSPENSLMVQSKIYAIFSMLYKFCTVSEKSDSPPIQNSPILLSILIPILQKILTPTI